MPSYLKTAMLCALCVAGSCYTWPFALAYSTTPKLQVTLLMEAGSDAFVLSIVAAVIMAYLTWEQWKYRRR